MEKRTSPAARIVATLALIGAVLAVVVVISSATDSGSSQNANGANGGGKAAKQQKPKQPRTKAKTYVVQSGDTLIAISNKTGVSVEEILALNPEVDPQILIAGEELKLR